MYKIVDYLMHKVDSCSRWLERKSHRRAIVLLANGYMFLCVFICYIIYMLNKLWRVLFPAP